MNVARLLAWIVLPLVGLVLIGALAVWVIKAALGFVIYILVGALVVGGGVYLYGRAKRALGPGTRARRRLDAASETYRMRNGG
jgi:O-antigen/teichoic acid export membrane protein